MESVHVLTGVFYLPDALSPYRRAYNKLGQVLGLMWGLNSEKV